MFMEIRPKPGDMVNFWTLADHEGEREVCNVAIVTGIDKEGVLEWRPYLNLCVFRANDSKPWPRLAVPAVHDDGSELYKAQRYSLLGEYE